MRSKLRFLSLALIIASSLGCGDGPTQPQTQPQTQPPIDLSGTWMLRLPGGGGPEVQVHQIGRSVTFEWYVVEFEGAIGLSGILTGEVVVDGYFHHRVSGTPTPVRILLTGDDYSLELTR